MVRKLLVVLLLVLTSPMQAQDDVVDCTNGHCKVSEGYSYTERAGSQQVIEIPSAEKSFQGRYQCQYDTHEPQDLKSCTLLVQEANLETGVETQENNVLVTTGDQEKDGQGGDSSVQDNDVIIFIVVPTAAALGIHLVAKGPLENANEEKRTRRSVEGATPNGHVLSEETMHGDLQQTPMFSNDSHHQSWESSVDG
ncbi:hypothetical protein BaRGS_00030752 [Batillaria attramentaria]|uniref:Uncharacterized protein n=1 Tax=Batillaria attramentaria TaxID=370345 RepID=A0ABD0JSM0_9CAEN